MAAVPPSRVEKNGKIAKAISTARANETLSGGRAAAARVGRYPVTYVMRDGITQSGALVRADQPWGDAQLAELFDAFFFDGDLPLYLELAREHGRKVLEIACGSGRVLVPLARAGCDVVGIDVSPHMLALAQAKLSGEHSARLIQADMRDFVLDQADFDLAIVAVK